MQHQESLADDKDVPLLINTSPGQAVDTIGQAGRPETITGASYRLLLRMCPLLTFVEISQAFKHKRLLCCLVMASELSLLQKITCRTLPILEGFVILRMNPDAPPPIKEEKKTSQ
jgi:hypothetical protein